MALADMSASQWEDYLGEKLYPGEIKFSSQKSGSAGKVVGMLLKGSVR